MKTTVSQRLMEAVKDADINYTEFAAMLGVVKQVVSAWKTGTREVPVKYVIKAIILLELDANYILRGVESPKNVDIASQEELYKKQMELYEEAKKRADELLKAKDEIMEMKDKIHQLATGKPNSKKKEANSEA